MPSLRGGGAERVVSILLKSLDRRKFAIHLALLANKENVVPLHRDVVVYDFNTARVRYGVCKLLFLLRSLQPDYAFSTLGYLNLIIMLFYSVLPGKTKFIARESNIPSLHIDKSNHPSILNFLYPRLYPRFHKIVCQSRDMQQDLVENFGLQSEKIALINNPVDCDMVRSLAESFSVELEGAISLLAVGKLMRQKGFDMLLKAVAGMNDERIGLTIIGEGDERKSLEELASSLQIADRVSFLGYVANPYPFMRKADLLVLSSRYEGFPNVVLEANACGTPVVAFDCPGGLREIIQDGVNGWLVPPADVNALAETIIQAIATPIQSDMVSSFIRQKFGIERILPLYEALFANGDH